MVEQDQLKTFGTRLRWAICQKFKNIQRFAIDRRYSQVDIYRWVNDKRVPKYPVVARLAADLDVSAGWLVFGEGNATMADYVKSERKPLARVLRRVGAAVAIAGAVAGCASPFATSVNGPVAVSIGDVAHMCRLSGYDSPRGCMMRHANASVEVFCQDGSRDELAECLAHELRHVIDPGWSH